LHAKAIWIDSGQSLVMSANLQRDGLDHGFELGLRFADERTQEVLERLEGWCVAAPWRLEYKPHLGALLGTVKLWKQEQLVDAEILTSVDVDLGGVTAESAAAMEAPRPQLPAETASLPTLSHELSCVWLVAAPTLAAKAKEQLRPAEEKDQPATGYQPAVFREPSGRLVVAVRSVDELDQARVVMSEVKAATIVVAEGAN
jgi:cardiolipin synthase A/B